MVKIPKSLEFMRFLPIFTYFDIANTRNYSISMTFFKYVISVTNFSDIHTYNDKKLINVNRKCKLNEGVDLFVVTS